MTKLNTHDEWVQEQFSIKYLRKSYRNVLVHASIIEGVLRNESGASHYSSANKSLLRIGAISSSEFCHFEAVRSTRNELVHGAYRNGLTQSEIDMLLKELIAQIKEVYKHSSFLGEKLFKKHSIVRPECIALAK
jgi:hypothetical protein